ncbi:MAG: hypothetical protein HY377_00885 [Candidatus Blackburnbacteria bacterium]|nr:hypothetical protein [Candidatus Blackburnbacteria bacterium]
MAPKIIPNEPSLAQPFWLGTVSILATALLLGIFWVKLPPQVPLLYSRTPGVDQLGNPFLLVLPLVLSIIFLIVNLAVARFIESDFLKRALVLGATLCAILASVTVVRIIFLIS